MIIIAPYSNKLKNGKENPKNYPYWQDVIYGIKKENKNYEIFQVGCSGDKILNDINGTFFNKSFTFLCDLLNNCQTWSSVDTYLQHIGAYVKKNGVVVWTRSDPEIFGYKNNVNILKNKKFLRENQFACWEEDEVNKDSFPDSDLIIKSIISLI